MIDFAAAYRRTEETAVATVELAIRAGGSVDLDRAACTALEFLEGVPLAIEWQELEP
jgi:hypothetical protein